MNTICPVCHASSIKKCEKCGFDIPNFVFLCEEDANHWYYDIVLPKREKIIFEENLLKQLKEAQELLNTLKSNEMRLLEQLNNTQKELDTSKRNEKILSETLKYAQRTLDASKMNEQHLLQQLQEMQRNNSFSINTGKSDWGGKYSIF